MSLLQPITPHLWFDREAREAAELYASVFPNSGIGEVRKLHGTPSGDAETVSFHLAGQPFMAISAGPHFRFTPAISFMANYDPSRDPQARENLDRAWAVLSEGGKVFMPLDAYPFSKRYGWVQDRFGISWQIVPAALDEMLRGSPEQVARVTQAFLKMKKFDIAALERAYAGGEDR